MLLKLKFQRVFITGINLTHDKNKNKVNIFVIE